jgi:hypothetical protein
MPLDLSGRCGGHAIKKLVIIILLALASATSGLQVHLVKSPMFECEYRVRATVGPKGPRIHIWRAEKIRFDGKLWFKGEKVNYVIQLQ